MTDEPKSFIIPNSLPQVRPADLILNEAVDATESKASFMVFNGPNQGTYVDAPMDATPGTACALPWRTAGGQTRYAVYVLVEWNGTKGLMFLKKSYDHPHQAAQRVQELTAICAAGMA